MTNSVNWPHKSSLSSVRGKPSKPPPSSTKPGSGSPHPEIRNGNGRGHFFAAAAEAMRRILIESARRKKRLKHGGQLERVAFEELEIACGMPSEELLALDEALHELEQVDPAAAELVKLRFFGGLNQPQAAEALGVSLSTVERSWAFSRAWLFRRLSDLNSSI
jgi:RNA polymerase sigma factor (TIGR02999 family)